MLSACKLSWCLALGLMAAGEATSTPSLRVDMKAAFPSPPYLLELLETAAGENASSYFPLLDRIANGHFAAAASEAELFSSFVNVLQDDGHITSAESLSTFNLALSLRSSAPRIEAHYQYYSTAVEPIVAGSEQNNCQNWVLLNDNQYCNAELEKPSRKSLFAQPVRHLPFDRTIGTGDEVVLYADPTSAEFGPYHKALYEAAKLGKLAYRLRYRLGGSVERRPLPVNGYGVELALKRTDYIVIDDREAGDDAAQKPIKSDVDLDKDEEPVEDLKPLSTSELMTLGMKAASFILGADNPFETLVKLTQDFPKYSSSVSAHEISKHFAAEHENNRLEKVPAGRNFLWMNGVQLIDRQIEPFALIDMLRRERKLIDGVRALGFTGKEAVSLLGHQEIAAAKSADDSPRYNWTDGQEGGDVILWLNDLEDENSPLYADFPKEVKSLLQRGMPGQLPPIAKNIFHLIIPVDLSDVADVDVAVRLLSFANRGIPIRFGLVPITSTLDGESRAKVAYHLLENYGIGAVSHYLKECFGASRAAANEEKLLQQTMGSWELQSTESKAMSLIEIRESNHYSDKAERAQKWMTRLGADTTVRPVFANGRAVPRDQSWMQAMSMKLAEDLQIVQQGVYTGAIDDHTSIIDILLKGSLNTRNMYVVPEGDEPPHIVDVHRLYTDHSDTLQAVPLLQAYAESTKENWAVMTVFADLLTEDGRKLALSAAAFKRDNPGVQVELVHNPSQTKGASRINSAVKANEDRLSELETQEELQNLLVASDTPGDAGFDVGLASLLATVSVSPGSQMLMLNGRLIGPITPEAPFTADDMQQLLDFEQSQRILPVYAAMEALGLGEKLSGPVAAAKVTSITALSTISDLPEGIFDSAPSIRSTLYDSLASEHSAIVAGNLDTASVHIVGVLDPVSEQGQRWSPILKVLSELDGVYVKLILNPKVKIDELPIKRFYRHVLESKPSFDEAGKVKGLAAIFKGLPSEALLTVGMDVPPAWLVSSKVSVHDLDNIKLSSINTDVKATYELEHILIEGHSREGSRGSPPRGAQLVLSTEKEPDLTDTIIMANIGYFQFKANPGYYNLRLKEGRSAEMYEIESVGSEGWAAAPGDEGTEVTLMDFKGTTLYPRLKRKPDMEGADVLETPDEANDSIIDKGIKFAGSLFGSGKALSGKKQADINIFSVASGHLYERMLNIMMVSVMRHTKQTVKFWFIEQFLSPSFKDFIPHMAAEYGFEYEMVTYKWPHWLRQQKEKQREIWGYKILFLDVLFPLDLDKVIFVDADQVVRTDMVDLVHHDLQGAPYGFTPMCDSRTEMDGFRFWKQGYWANFLRGRPYHISALYVVDLRRFRQIAAGDRLRQQYHSLSADPNSLANLDQDLPNNMQFQIPIHSLPQDWLWCETWCSDGALAGARTIDLCNNPQTKEPKLDRARRQVPEWTEYDEEIAALDRRRRGLGKTTEGAAKDGEKKQHQEGVNTKSRRFEEEPVHTIDEL